MCSSQVSIDHQKSSNESHEQISQAMHVMVLSGLLFLLLNQHLPVQAASLIIRDIGASEGHYLQSAVLCAREL